MHLAELLALRATPLAGISLGLTRRCPLRCGHCSTDSSITSEQYPASVFSHFVSSFTRDEHPEVIFMSGGEALLRPNLVIELATRARRTGAKSALLSGMFFANLQVIPQRLLHAILSVDHFSASIDVFHEREVHRQNVFKALRYIISLGQSVSIQAVGRDGGDGYLTTLIKDVADAFDSKVPMLVSSYAPFGRAKSWLSPDLTQIETESSADPCVMAAWPGVAFDGTILACGNDNALTSKPSHLVIGDSRTDDWSTIRRRSLESSILRAIRLFGPKYTLNRIQASGIRACSGYCDACMEHLGDSHLRQPISTLMNAEGTKLIEELALMPALPYSAVTFARTHGIPRYAHLVNAGLNYRL
ncbi:MAG TPA: radical SAM protein [Terracidiphilus sp.]|jgi:pyruvate-formate lyase-activating enzyme